MGRIKLKPCPFCGESEQKYLTVVREGTNRRSCQVQCENCGCSLESNEIGYGDAWNRRFNEQDIQKISDECSDSSVTICSQYVGEVFQWLIDNNYSICKTITNEEEKSDYGISEITGNPKCKDCDNEELNGFSSHCKSCGDPIVY